MHAKVLSIVNLSCSDYALRFWYGLKIHIGNQGALGRSKIDLSITKMIDKACLYSGKGTSD